MSEIKSNDTNREGKKKRNWKKKKQTKNPSPKIIDESTVQVVAPIKAKSRLRFRLNTSKFATNPEKSATSTLGLVDGNSTITVNTVGDTTDDSSGEHKKGIDLAPANTVSAFNNYSPSWREVSVQAALSNNIVHNKIQVLCVYVCVESLFDFPYTYRSIYFGYSHFVACFHFILIIIDIWLPLLASS